MTAWKQFAWGIIAILGCSVCSAALWAQEQGDDKPKPAARVLLPLPDLGGDQQDDQGQTMQPDRGPVSGVQAGTLGTSELRHSYWVTGLQYGYTAQTNTVNTSQTSGWTSSNYPSGNLSLLEAWGHSQFGMNYSGGGFFSSSGQGNGQFHQLASAFELDQKRWQMLVIEQLSYLPQTAFGFGGTTLLAVPGITGALAAPLPGLQQTFVPGQSAFSATGPRYSSASATQLTYAVSRRGSLTAAVVYGLLRFNDAGNINSDTEILNVGYNYAITRKDYLGVIYRFTAYRFPGDPQALGDQLFQLMYARRITSKLALNIAGGPDWTNFRVPVNGTSRSLSGGGMASLSCPLGKGALRVGYSHGIGSGSGVFAGSSSDEVTATWGRPISRAWIASLKMGYSRNSTIVTLKALSSPSYASWLAGAGLYRPLGRSARFSLGYQAQIQASNGLICNTPGCQTTQVSHQIQTSIQWNAPPQVIR